MKTKMFCFLAFLIALTGCNKIKDMATVTVSTELTADIPIVIEPGKKSGDQVGAVNLISFTKTQELSLASNADIAKYIEKIKEINLNSLVVTVTGLSADQTISTVSLDVAGVGNIFTQNNITMSSNSFTPAIAPATLANVAAKLTSDKKITLTVSGSASGPMAFVVGLNFDTSVIAYLL